MGDGTVQEFVIGLVIVLVFILGMDTVFLFYEARKRLVDNGHLIKTFPDWEGTKKPRYWLMGWTVAKYIFDLAWMLAFFFITVEIYGDIMMVFALVSWPFLSLTQLSLYLIVEKIMVVVKRKKGNLSKTATDNKENTVAKEPIDSDSDRAE